MGHFNFRYTRYYKVLIAVYRILGFTIYDFLKKNPEVCYVNEENRVEVFKVTESGFYSKKDDRGIFSEKADFYTFLEDVAKINSIELTYDSLLEILGEIFLVNKRFLLFRRRGFNALKEGNGIVYLQGEKYLIPSMILKISPRALEIYREVFKDEYFYVGNEYGVGIKLDEIDFFAESSTYLSEEDFILISLFLFLRPYNISFLHSDMYHRYLKYKDPYFYLRYKVFPRRSRRKQNAFLLLNIVNVIFKSPGGATRSSVREFIEEIVKNPPEHYVDPLADSYTKKLEEAWLEYRFLTETFSKAGYIEKDLLEKSLKNIFDSLLYM